MPFFVVVKCTTFVFEAASIYHTIVIKNNNSNSSSNNNNNNNNNNNDDDDDDDNDDDDDDDNNGNNSNNNNIGRVKIKLTFRNLLSTSSFKCSELKKTKQNNHKPFEKSHYSFSVCHIHLEV